MCRPRLADRLCPGWQRSLESGADLTKMVPGAASMHSASMPVMAVASLPIQAVYNPTPPVKPSAKKQSTGCMGVLLMCAAVGSGAVVLLADVLR